MGISHLSSFFVIDGKRERNSSMELLRIVAMTMILIYHFLFHALVSRGGGDSASLSPYYTLLFSGVNLFFMTSGYFGIRLSVKGIVRFLFTIAFFEVVNWLACCAAGVNPGKWQLVNCTLNLLYTHYWFINVYILLMLMAPLLNAGLKHVSVRYLGWMLLIIGVTLQVSGPCVANMNYLGGLYMYCLGYWLHRVRLWERLPQLWWLILFILIEGGAGVWQHWHWGEYFAPYYRLFDYGFIINILGPAALFLFFAGLRFRSRGVNLLAAASMGCYLLQDGLFGFNYLYQAQGDYFMHHSIGSSVAMFAACLAGFWACSYLLTALRNILIRPIADWCAGYISRLIDKDVSVR